MNADINNIILESIEDTWKPISTIAHELDENVSRVNKCIISLKKRDKVLYRYSEKKKAGKVPLEYIRK